MLQKGDINLDESILNCNNKPQELCKMCGKCCRVVTTPYSFEELNKLKKNGDIGAIDFLEIFEPYNSIEEAKKENEETVNNIINAIKSDDIIDEKSLTFYKCKYIQEDNKCAIYKKRKELCKIFPSSVWAVIPPGCGYEEWLAQKREEIKQKVIKQKKNLLEVEELLKNAQNDEEKKRIEITRNKIKNTIDAFAKYGAENW